MDNPWWQPNRALRWHHPGSLLGGDTHDPGLGKDQLGPVVGVRRDGFAAIEVCGVGDDRIGERKCLF